MQRQNDDIEVALRWEELEIGEFTQKLHGLTWPSEFSCNVGETTLESDVPI